MNASKRYAIFGFQKEELEEISRVAKAYNLSPRKLILRMVSLLAEEHLSGDKIRDTHLSRQVLNLKMETTNDDI